jgi:hypothetical protein
VEALELQAVTALAWWLLLFGIWPIADPGHRSLEPMVIADLCLHLGALAFLVAHYWPQRDRLLNRTIGCCVGAHRSCTGWGDASRRHGLGAQVPCSCRCHHDRWEVWS